LFVNSTRRLNSSGFCVGIPANTDKNCSLVIYIIMSEDYTSKTIISTYKSILHIGGDKGIYDGTGSVVICPSSSFSITSSYALSSKYTTDSASISSNIGNRLLTSTYITYSASVSSSLVTKIGDSYETVSQNLKDYPTSLTYSGTTLLHVTHSLSDGSNIYETFTYSGSYITTSSLSGNLPIGIKTNKILSYNSNGSVVGINYT